MRSGAVKLERPKIRILRKLNLKSPFFLNVTRDIYLWRVEECKKSNETFITIILLAELAKQFSELSSARSELCPPPTNLFLVQPPDWQ